MTSARKNAGSGIECSDAVRVVNALLTQLDSIRRHPNLLVLTTSNLTGSIDLAFVDRADIKQYIGLPNSHAINSIYEDCLEELIEKNVVIMEDEMQWDSVKERLEEISRQSDGFSGRTLRKLPFLALTSCHGEPEIPVHVFLDHLESSVKKQIEERAAIRFSENTA